MEQIKTAYQELQEVRFELSKASLKKTGKNNYQGFEYFELKDFLPTATDLFKKHDLTPVFNVELSPEGIEYAILDVFYKGSEKITFKAPTARPNGKNPIQDLGAMITYMRRYLYLMALDIVENDIVDSQDQNEVKKNAVKYATDFQVEKIIANGKLIASELNELNIKTKNDCKTLSIEKASELCKLIEERKVNNNGTN